MPTEIDPILREIRSGSSLSGSLGVGYLEEQQVLRHGLSISGSLSHGWLQLFDQNSMWGSGVSGSLSNARAFDTETWTYIESYGQSVSGAVAFGYAVIEYDPLLVTVYYPESQYQNAGSVSSAAYVSGSVESEYQA